MLKAIWNSMHKSVALILILFLASTILVMPAHAVDRSSLIIRLQELRSTSPESGAYALEAATFNLAVNEAVIEDLQTMSEHVALGMQCESPEVREISNSWSGEVEGLLDGAYQKRSRLVKERLAALRSTSPESGIE